MFCFCYDEFFKNPLALSSLEFTEFGDKDAPFFCNEFQGDYQTILFM